MKRLSAERAIGAGLAVCGLALAAALALLVGSAVLDNGHSPTPSGPAGASPVAHASPALTATSSQPGATSSAAPTAPPSFPSPPAPSAAPTISPPLPAMLAAIGDSYTQAWSVSPAYPKDHPGYSWAVGTVKGDGVFSLRERFEALGDQLVVVDAATSGKKMSDAARQATKIVTSAKTLPPGATVYVTFELGTNDLCDTPTTDPAVFETELRSAIAILRSGLPSGSEILMLSVPDFAHYYDITQASSKAAAILALPSHSQTCAPFLGSDSPLSIKAAEQLLANYDAILAQVCDEIEATDGKVGALYCRYNEALLSESNFTIADLSTVDYFHPSLSGQAKMAAAAWQAGYWAELQLPSGAAAVAPGGNGAIALAGLAPAAPLLVARRLRRRQRRPRLGPP